MILWLDLFLRLFVQALAFGLAAVATVAISLMAAVGVVKLYAALPPRRRRR